LSNHSRVDAEARAISDALVVAGRSPAGRSERPVRRIGILHHPKIAVSRPLADEIAELVGSQGVEAWQGSAWDEAGVAQQIGNFDLVITLGGDGTILRAARMCASHNVPVLGINLGRLGFLAELAPDEWRERIPRVLAGDYWIEERMMLRAESYHAGEKVAVYEALNDVVLSRGGLARIVAVETHIDGGRLTTFIADGVIVATATGSTAYALAVGGPIMPPTLRNILLIPIAPHLTLNRAVILSEGDSVTLKISTDHRARLTVDGQFDQNLIDGDHVHVSASPHRCKFARLQSETYFYETLMEKLRWRT
jgi:NAD+ kinase